ncbi:hypothetical protein AKO1_013369, partial [Acrasis kona]
MTNLRQRISLVEKFIVARELAKRHQESVSSEMVNICQVLLEEPAIEDAIRIGDVYALLVEHYWLQQADGHQAYKLICKMRERSIVLSYYLEESLIREVYQYAGVEYPGDNGDTSPGNQGHDDEEIEEEMDD